MAELRSSNNGSRSAEEGGIHIKELKITANEVHFGDGVTVDKISEQNSGDTIFLENELTTGIEGELPPGSKRQVPTGSEVQVLTGCTGEVSTGSKTQVSTDSMGHLKTGSEIQMPTDNIEQMSTVNKTQVSTDTTVQVSTGNEIQESEGCESQMDLSDEISTDDCDDEEKPLLNSKVGEDEEKPLLNSKDGEDEEKPLLNSKVGEDEEKPLLNSKVGEDEEKPLLNSKVGEDEEKSLLNSKVGEDEEKPLLNSKVGEDEEKPLLNSKADNLGKLQMIDFLSRKKYGISTVYLQDVSEDGHCLEYAFIMLLKQNYPNEYEEMDVEKLRRYLVKFLKSNPNTPGGQQYKEFLSLPSDPDRGLIHPEDIAIEENVENISDQMELRWQRFLKRIQDGDWGGSVELQGLSQMFDVPINVLRLNENQDDLLQYNFNSGLDNYQNPPIWLGRISLEGKGFHFVALLPVELLTTRASDGSE